LLAVLGYGGTLTMAGELTVGDLSAFLLYTAYVGASVAGLASFHAELMKGLGASERIFALLERPQERVAGVTIPPDEFQGGYLFLI
jgi:ABC-type multidrug transport system fused ATPase/permease subunit